MFLGVREAHVEELARTGDLGVNNVELDVATPDTERLVLAADGFHTNSIPLHMRWILRTPGGLLVTIGSTAFEGAANQLSANTAFFLKLVPFYIPPGCALRCFVGNLEALATITMRAVWTDRDLRDRGSQHR